MHTCATPSPAQHYPHPEERPLGRVSKDRPQAPLRHPSRRRASARLLRMRGDVWLVEVCACPSACAGTTPSYASPSVSNIAALIASVADLPAQTTNWKAG